MALLLFCHRAQATGGDDPDDNVSCFFAPEIIGNKEESPFFLSGHSFYEQADDDNDADGGIPFSSIEAVNTKEWAAYFRNKVSAENLRFLIYKMSLGELDKLIWATEGRRQTLSKEATAVKVELDALGNKPQVLRVLYYLGFAKRCEPIALRRITVNVWDANVWASASARDSETAGKLLAASEAQLAAVSDPFLQERYRFQRLRLMFYTGRYADAERYYVANIAAFASESSVKYRFLSTAAGAFYHDKNYGQANYLYSLVFGHFAPLKRSAYLSFRPAEDADWKASLALSKSTSERAVLWQMLGIRADGLGAIEQLYALAPDSKLLPLLLVREVNAAEVAWAKLGSPLADGPPLRSAADLLGKRRLALLQRITDEKRTYKGYLWQLGLGHLYSMIGDSKSAASYLNLAEKAAGADPAALTQLRLSRLLAQVQSKKGIDKALEGSLATELPWLQKAPSGKAAELRSWLLARLRQRYQKAGDIYRATLLVDAADADLYRNNRRIDGLLALLDRPDKSLFDAMLAANYPYSKGQLNELKALNDLYAGRFQSAADLLAAAGPEVANQKLAADPFAVRIVDCHDCDAAAKQATRYTKGTFTQKLLALSKAADGSGAAAAEASFQLASGLYNMSYYGNARDVYATAHDNFSAKSPLNLSMQLAEKYYQRAMALATDKELSARACFMAAKTEQNRFFTAQELGRSNSKRQPTQSHVYFQQLKESYANTRYYQEIIRECGYFRSYLKR